MKTLALALASVAVLSAPVLAADLAMKYPVKTLQAPVFSWTGFYIGANVGYGGGDPSATAVTASAGALVSYETASLNSSGFFAGGQVGYNYQFANNVVLGLETDLQWSGVQARVSGTAYDTTGALTNSLDVGGAIDYFGTVRARLGYAMDRFLPYLTGGLAYGRTTVDGTYHDSGTAIVGSGAATQWGWTLGAGGEFAVANNWTLKAEYLYVDLGSVDYYFYESSNAIKTFGSADSKMHTMKAGVNYKF
ncbi:outer membrane protein [Xanthobacter sp. AM11]|uniref:outer membrane protein n=1 Tax=Xanthobacter sp. AM11 TaxID=3380643 RepID=UPI0039BEE87D